ncbi:alpha-ketoglutarate-dependent dioxygenase AlkB family protein [Idiomarina xiamenensis]|uniref:2OG-Fe(II) oxygenase n=1 Tax=Idiomarina xiamenensis 10-D-4 TaxID=740709 RepID=K2K837_9GAMM|nr:alpha-ketoglutarate-dependent dioxygenase AlkB [Idiomarina xiamenensis]EKE83883.1 2OG-Fe(II) oxygenase [Idiomarina xiamenensis 10-D-4]
MQQTLAFQSAVAQTQVPLPDADVQYFPRWLADDAAEQLKIELQQQLDWRQDQIRLFGRMVAIPRLQAWYGDAGLRYSYSGLSLTANPWTANLQQLREQMQQLCECRFNAVLLNWYRDGQDSMGWHSDDEAELGEQPVIASLSLGQPRRFMLRHKSEPASHELALGAGDVLVMRGDTQRYWQHQVPKQRQLAGDRINLTFRYIDSALAVSKRLG